MNFHIRRFGVLLGLVFSALFAANVCAQETWTPRPSGTTANLWSVVYGGNQWVAVGDQGTILTSPDGVAWTRRVSGNTLWLVGVGYGNGLFVVVGDQGAILTSSDGITWTSRKSGGTRINAVAYGNGVFLAADDQGSCWVSNDGTSWTERRTNRTGINVSNYLRGLVFGASQFVITGANSIQTTFDGSAFETRVGSVSAEMIEGLACGRRMFVAAGAAGTTFASRNAVTWGQQPTTTDITVRGAAYFNNQFIAVGNAAVNGGGIVTSFDGAQWTPRVSGLSAGGTLLAVAAGPDSAVAVGQVGAILRSTATSNAPAIVAQPFGVTEAIGGNVAFIVTASGSSPLTYQWLKNGAAISGATADTLFLPVVNIASAGNYKCTVTNAAGSAASTNAALTVLNVLPSRDPVDGSFVAGPLFDKMPRAAALQSDGKLLLGGDFLILNEGRAQVGLARLLSNGALDPTFKPGTISPDGYVSTLTVQPDGKILAGGLFSTINNTARTNLARLNSDGTVDTSFDPTSVLTTEPRQVIAGTAGAVLLIGGEKTITRLLANGAIDPTFIRESTDGTHFMADVQADGKILVGKYRFTASRIEIRRFNRDGSVDSTYGNPSLPTGPDRISSTSLRVLPDGRVMAAAQAVFYGGRGYSYGVFAVRRFTAAGEVDSSFSGFEKAYQSSLTFRSYEPFPFTAAAFTAEGKTWLSGGWTQLNGVGRNQLARLTIDGLLDPTFNPGTGTDQQSVASIIIPLADGRAYAIGWFSKVNDTARRYVVRLNARAEGGANSPVIVAVDPIEAVVRAGEPLVLNVMATGSAPLSYSVGYQNELQNIILQNNAASTITVSNVQASGIYTISAINTVATSLGVFISVNVLPTAPTVRNQPASVQTNIGLPVILSVDSAGSDPRTYQWFKNGIPVNGATVATYSLASATVADTGNFTVVIRNSLGFASSNPATVTVNAVVVPTIATQPVGQIVKIGANTSFSISVFGTTPSYQWRKNGTAIPGATNSILTASNIAAADAGSYDIVVGNSAGSITSNVATLTVDEHLPFITVQPRNQMVTVGQSVILSVTAAGGSAPAYQWRRNASNIIGATAATLALTNAQPSDAGTYSLVISNAAGSLTSDSVTLTVLPSARLANGSVRTTLTSGQTLIVGFAISGGTKDVLVRAAGPALGDYGVSAAITDPRLELYSGATKILENDNWPGILVNTFGRLAAFPFVANSRDAALLQSMSGSYSVLASGTGPGVLLVEAYDAGSGNAARLVNLSARNRVGIGEDTLIAGFYVAGTGSIRVLIRAVGPTLGGLPFNVPSTLSDPKLEIYDANGVKINENDTWNASLSATFTSVAAFPLTAGSKDAAMVVTLPAGSTYTAQVKGADGGTGEALVEIYELL